MYNLFLYTHDQGLSRLMIGDFEVEPLKYATSFLEWQGNKITREVGHGNFAHKLFLSWITHYMQSYNKPSTPARARVVTYFKD